MTTTKPPVLTDEDIENTLIRAGARWDGSRWIIEDADLHPAMRAVLERAGADAVRDAALEEAVRELEKRRGLLRGQYESVNITEADAMYGLCIEAIRALKGTPAAAVLPDPHGCRKCQHPDCGRYDGPRYVECRAMADNACAREYGDLSAEPAAAVADAQPVRDDTHAFKNFHRSLCERFGYTHDEIDWRRDQVSLIEHISAQAGQLSGNAGEVDSAAVLPDMPQPDSYLFQHEETGLTQCIDGQQVEWGFETHNPRLQRIGGMFTESQMQDYARAAIAASKGANHG